MENTNKEAVNEVLNVQLNSIEGFNMGDDLMKKSVGDIESLARTREVLNRIENDNKRLEIEREESKAKTKQGWISTISGLLRIGFSGLLYFLTTVDDAIDEHNGDIKSRSQLDLSRVFKDSLVRNIRGKRG